MTIRATTFLLHLLFAAVLCAGEEEWSTEEPGTTTEEPASCGNPIAYASECTVTSLCDGSTDDYSSSSSGGSGSLCYRIRSCFLGYCSTTDLQEWTDGTEDICTYMDDLLDDMVEGDENGFCVEGWDSSWWMTEYLQAVDCDDTSTVYLDCSESIGDVTSSTTASLGFSGIGLVGVALAVFWKRRRSPTSSTDHVRTTGVMMVQSSDGTKSDTPAVANFVRMT